MNIAPALYPDRDAYSLAYLAKKTGVSVDILRRHVNGQTDYPLVATYPSDKAMVDHDEYKRWWDSLPKGEKP